MVCRQRRQHIPPLRQYGRGRECQPQRLPLRPMLQSLRATASVCHVLLVIAAPVVQLYQHNRQHVPRIPMLQALQSHAHNAPLEVSQLPLQAPFQAPCACAISATIPPRDIISQLLRPLVQYHVLNAWQVLQQLQRVPPQLHNVTVMLDGTVPQQAVMDSNHALSVRLVPPLQVPSHR